MSGAIGQKIFDMALGWSWDYLLLSNITLSFSDVIFIVGIIISAILMTIGIRALRVPTKKMGEIEKIGGVKAYLFFPIETPEENWTLDYHSKHLQKRLIVNLNVHPPKAYFMTDSKDSYGWQLVNKYSRMWKGERHSDYLDEYFIKRWCRAKGYTLIERVASKEDLLDKN